MMVSNNPAFDIAWPLILHSRVLENVEFRHVDTSIVSIRFEWYSAGRVEREAHSIEHKYS